MATYTTLKAQVTGIVMRPLHSDAATALTLMDYVINAPIRDLQRRHSFGCMESVLILPTVHGTEYVPLGDTYKGMLEGKDEKGCVYWLDGTSWVKIPMLYVGEELSLPRLRELYPDPTIEGEPAYCCVFARQLYLAPTPDAIYSLQVPCYVKLADLSSAAPTNWFSEQLDDVLLWEMVALARLVLDEPSAASSWSGVSEATLERAMAEDRRERATRVGPRSARLRQA
jgi:hypothetical protein